MVQMRPSDWLLVQGAPIPFTRLITLIFPASCNFFTQFLFQSLLEYSQLLNSFCLFFIKRYQSVSLRYSNGKGICQHSLLVVVFWQVPSSFDVLDAFTYVSNSGSGKRTKYIFPVKIKITLEICQLGKK